jgi:hypothetical protein
VMVENGGTPILTRNDSKTSNAIRVRLVGEAPNTMALGAKVRVVSAGRFSEQMVRTGSSYMSQSETVLTFGLGAATVADSLVVRWGKNSPTLLTSLVAGQTVVISQNGSVVEVPFVESN